MTKNEPKIWLISDPHFYHKNILKYCKGRIPKLKKWAAEHDVVVTDENIVDVMDMWIIDIWNSTVSKHDKVYILGDFSFGTRVENEKLLDKLNGKKYLIIGNHDGNPDTLYNKFNMFRAVPLPYEVVEPNGTRHDTATRPLPQQHVQDQLHDW